MSQLRTLEQWDYPILGNFLCLVKEPLDKFIWFKMLLTTNNMQ